MTMRRPEQASKRTSEQGKLPFSFVSGSLARLLPCSLALLAALFFGAVPSWAGSDMSSASYKIRRSDINSGGSHKGTSASRKLTSSIGTGGGSLFQGTTYFVYSGFSNVVSHPDAIEDLAVITGPSLGTMVLTWTAPAAYGSTGTASSYAVRQQATPFTDELSFVNATLVANAWVPLTPGALEARTLSSLSSNTTYYFAVKGADAAGNTGYLSNNSAASTLTDAVGGIQYTNVYQSSVTLSWTGLGSGNAEGYVVQGATVNAPSFGNAGTIRSSATADGLQTTLTVQNLRRGKLTYFRVGGLNWNSVANFVSAGSTTTLPGPAPLGAVWTKVNASSITLVWGGVASDDGYSAEAAANNLFTSITVSSVTADIAQSTLTLQGLSANATYYLRVGSLYDDATSYANTTPISTITVAAIPTNGVFSGVTPSSITIGWNGSINAAGTNFQADISSISAFGASTATVTTSLLTTSFSGLTQDTTYWTRVKALGWAGANSPYLIIGSSITGTTITPLIIPTFTGFTEVHLTSVTVSWLPSGGPQFVYDVDLVPANPFGAHVTLTSVAGSSAAVTGLNVDALYSARVRAHSLSSGHVSSYSNFFSTSTLAEPPLSLSTTAVSNASIWLTWNGNGNPSGALYSVERSTDGIAFVQAGAVRTTSFQDQSLIGGTAYAYRVRTINEIGVASDWSNTILVMTTGVSSVPKRPSGLWAERTASGGGNFQITYHWHRVTERVDGSAVNNLTGYEIYVSSSLLLPRAQWTLLTTVGTESWSATANPAQVNYYCLKAIDGNGLRSDWTQILDDSVDMNHFFLYADNVTRVQLPMSAANLLRSEHNNYGADLWVSLEEVPSDETGRVVRSMKLMVTNTISGSAVTDLLFDPPVLRGIIGYSVQGGNVVAGAPEPTTAFISNKMPVISAANAPQQLSLFWFNGVEWVKTTGLVNAADTTVNFTGGRTGLFQIRAATHAPGATLTRVYPRIITPNGDGWNDKAIFQFDNPELLPLSGKVYDISGAFVANLVPGLANPDSSLAWDGKSNGATVPAGIYIYQIDLGGSPESGTIVVAR